MDNDSLHITCAHCLAVNRVPRARLDQDPVCGRCGREILDGAPAVLTDANFDQVIGRTELPVLVDFWATWCGPCLQMAPHFEKAARQLKGRALLVKVDSDQSPQLSSRYGIRSIPTLVRFAGGKEVARQSGALPERQIVAMVG